MLSLDIPQRNGSGDRASPRLTVGLTELVGPHARQIIAHDPRSQFSIFTLDSQNHLVTRQQAATDTSRSTRMTTAATVPGLSTAGNEETRHGGV